MYKRIWLFSLLLAMDASIGQAEVPEKALGLAEQLASLRGDVESLYAKIEAKREEQRAEMRSLAAQKSELELSIEKEQMRLAGLREAMQKQQKRIAEAQKQGTELQPVLQQVAEAIRAWIKEGLPFQKEERLAEVQRLLEQIQGNLLRPAVALGQLWERIEDEMRLARESGLYRQIIELDGQNLLSEVVRIGMIMLFFRTPDGRVGWAVCNDQGGWSYRPCPERSDEARVNMIFDSFRKQIRTGWFELPNALCYRSR